MPTNYTGQFALANAPGPLPVIGAVPISSLPVDGDALNASSVRQALEEPLDFIAMISNYLYLRNFGDGSDGAGAPDGIGTAVPGMTWMSGPGYYVMTRDCYFTTLSMIGWVKTNGYAIYATTSIGFSGAAILDGSGANATTTTGGNLAASAGPHICPGPNGAALAANNVPASYLCGLGGSGVGGGAGSGNAASAGAVISIQSPSYKFAPYRTGQIPQNNLGTTGRTLDYIRGGGCGGAGGGDSTNAGGGGGEGGALVVMCSPSITLAAGAVLESNGGNGGSPGAGNTGGGSGGSGGAFLLVCRSYTNSSGTILAAAGTGGTHHGSGASDGSSGNAGVTTPFVVTI